ncbi:NAD(P)/FAD-dependent oxidoreductase [Modestobacter lapidis]|nr:oxidoreductase [Modestobacter lapidis]
MTAAVPSRVVVVGAGLAGLRTAQGLRRAGFDGELVVLGEEPHLPYDRPPLSKQLLLGSWDADRVRLAAPDVLAGAEIAVRTGERVTGLDPAGHRLTLASGEPLDYGALVVATGATPHAWPFDARGLAGVHDLRRLEDALALADAFTAGARVAVVGAGFIGTEVASAARQRGLEVTVVDASLHPLEAALGPVGAGALLDLHRSRGVTFRLGRRVTGLTGTGRVEALVLDDGSRVPADVVIVGIGVRPATDWLAGHGVDVRHGLPAEATGTTPFPDVWAVGDVAAWPAAGGGPPRPVEHWTNAVEQAGLVSANLLRAPAERRHQEPLPYVWTDHYGIRVQQLGELRAGDETTLVHGSVAALEFVLGYCRDGRVTGTLSVGLPTAFPKLKAAVRAGRSPADLSALL